MDKDYDRKLIERSKLPNNRDGETWAIVGIRGTGEGRRMLCKATSVVAATVTTMRLDASGKYSDLDMYRLDEKSGQWVHESDL